MEIIIWEQFLDLVPIGREVVVDSIETGVLTVDTDHRVIDVNQFARRTFELDEDEQLLGQHIDDVFEDRPTIREAYWSSTEMDSGETVEIESSGRHYAIEVADVHKPAGRIVGRSFMIRDVTDRYRERQRIRRERDLKELIRSILVRLSSRPDIEHAVCDRLVSDDRYTGVWIGDRSEGGDVGPRTYASGAGEVSRQSTADATVDLSTATARTALETNDIVIDREPSQDQSNSDDAPQSDSNVRAVAAIPLTHNDLTYGVLVICTSRTDAFGPEEQQLLTELSESVSFAFHAVEQREALQGETVREVSVRIRDSAHYLVSLAKSSPVAEVNPTVEVYEIGSGSREDTREPPDDTKEPDCRLQFLTVSGISADPVVEHITGHIDVQSVTVLTASDETVSLRVCVRPPTLGSLIAEAGGTVETVRIEDETVEAVAEFSLRADMNRVLEHVRDVYPDATVASLITKEPAAARAEPVALASLTAKQRESLEAAYHSGFFERPQRQTAEEIATTLDVSRSTFLSHLRTAENKVLRALLARSEQERAEAVD